MNRVLSDSSTTPIRIGAAGALGAITLLWAGQLNSAFFEAGTLLLTICLVPLAAGLGLRGGMIIGVLLAAVWVAARMGSAPTADSVTLLSPVNLLVVVVMLGIGALSGTHLVGAAAAAAPEQASRQPPGLRRIEPTLQAMATALNTHREWLANLEPVAGPWQSFDTHIRELARQLTAARHVRCYRVDASGQLRQLGKPSATEPAVLPPHELVEHVLTTGRRFVAGAAQTGPMVEQLAAGAEQPICWALPIREGGKPIGLLVAEGFTGGPPDPEVLEPAADLIEEVWTHVWHLDALRLARLTDQGSGVITRIELLPAVDEALARSYMVNEPAVVMVVCLEGLRSLDDLRQWRQRDALIEAVGKAMAAGLRKDDIVGRFSDAQFVAVLRRMDTALAELICRKLMAGIARAVSERELTEWITPRAGLCGSGLTSAPSEVLLQGAMEALATARHEDVLLACQAPAEARPREAQA